RRCTPAGPQFRARDQRVLSDGHRSAPHAGAQGRTQGRERVALRPALVRRAVRTARAASADPVPAARDHGILMAGVVHLESPAARAIYDKWADTYPGFAHNPLMRLEQEIVESILMTL